MTKRENPTFPAEEIGNHGSLELGSKFIEVGSLVLLSPLSLGGLGIFQRTRGRLGPGFPMQRSSGSSTDQPSHHYRSILV